jgi:thiamine-phosphate pyrophosphorylase
VAGVRSDVKSWNTYVLTDATLSRGRSHVEVAAEAISGGADVIQFREKDAPGRVLYEIAREIRRLTRDADVPFIVNDRVDVALAAGADGVHVGQEDLPAIGSSAFPPLRWRRRSVANGTAPTTSASGRCSRHG